MSVLLRHEGCDECGSSDAKAVYKDDDDSLSSHCFSCGATVASASYKEQNKPKIKQVKTKVKKESNMSEEFSEEIKDKSKIKPNISAEHSKEIKDSTSYKLNNWRLINDETSKFFGIRAEYSEDDELISVYYPITNDSGLSGYKKRLLPKSFSSVGLTGKDSHLFGQFRYKNKAAKYCLITEGESCTLAAYQMLKEYQDSRGGEYEPPVVVGITVGAQSAHTQVAANYAFFEQFSKVIYAADMDKPGQDSIEKVAKALPRGKAFILKGDLKDCAEYLEKGKEKAFINYFYKAQAWTPASLHSSNELYEEALKYADLDKIALPSWLSKMNDMLAGGITKGTLTLIAAASSIGKSTFTNQLVVDWVMDNRKKAEDRKEVFGILSLEATAGEFATQLLSYYCKQKFINIKDRAERVRVMSQPEVAKKAKELFTDENGLPSFLLCDDRGADLDDIEEKIEEMIRSMGITILMIDVTSDLFAGVENSRQEEHMAFQKRIVKETGVSIINVVHTRKSQSGDKDKSRGAELSDSDIIGSSTLVKSASVVIGLIRDKMADTDLERNTTKLRIMKSRHAGATGDAGSLFYDVQEHKLVDLDIYMQENGITPENKQFDF
jgi:twinkle protein